MRPRSDCRALRFRAFVSVDISPNDSLAALLEYLKGSVASLKVVKPSNMHLTLKFLGDTEEALVEDIVKAIADSTRGRKPFEVRLRGMGAFPSLSNIRVVWVGMENGSELVELAEGLVTRCKKLIAEKEELQRRHAASLKLIRGIVSEVKRSDLVRFVDKQVQESPELEKVKGILLECKTVDEAKKKAVTLSEVVKPGTNPKRLLKEDLPPITDGSAKRAGKTSDEETLEESTSSGDALVDMVAKRIG